MFLDFAITFLCMHYQTQLIWFYKSKSIAIELRNILQWNEIFRRRRRKIAILSVSHHRICIQIKNEHSWFYFRLRWKTSINFPMKTWTFKDILVFALILCVYTCVFIYTGATLVFINTYYIVVHALCTFFDILKN